VSGLGIRIERVTVDEIVSFAESMRGRLDEVVDSPVSLHRARAWAHNPVSEAGDTALLVAFHGARCAGYLGIMPGWVRSGEEREKVFWLSTLFVPPEYRSHAVGARLILELRRLEHDVVVTGVSGQAARLYLASGFKHLGPLQYVTLELTRLDLGSLPLRAIRRLVRTASAHETPRIDAGIDRVRRLVRDPALKALGRHLKQAEGVVAVVTKIPPGPAPGRPAEASTWFERGAPIVNWMLRYPGVVRDRAEGTRAFHFQDWDPHFELRALELRDLVSDDRRFLVIRRASRHGRKVITVFDDDIAGTIPPDRLLAVALSQARDLTADRVVLPAAVEPLLADTSLGRTLHMRRSRDYYCLIRRPAGLLQRSGGKVRLALADGDAAFA